MTFQPIDPIELAQLAEQVRVSGLRNDQARFVVRALTRTEAERQRLQAQVEGASEQKRALRSMMNDEAQQQRSELAAAQKRIAELESSPRFVETIEQQREVDARTSAMAKRMVDERDPKTLDEAKVFAQNWIETAAQEQRNAEYYRSERDKLEADMQRLRALIDGAHI